MTPAVVMTLAIADITLHQELLIWGVAPPVAPMVVVIAGLLVRKVSPRRGLVLLVVGALGLVTSAAWVAFLFYVDSVLSDT